MLRPHHLLKEPFRRGNVASGAEHELDCIASLVHGAVKILTRLPDSDVGLANPIRRAAHLQMLTDALIDFRGVTLYPTKDGRMVHTESTLSHHLFDIAVR
jgi:hypothetical protein